MNTLEFATQHGICIDDKCTPVAPYDELPARSASEIAIRTVVLQGVVAVAAGVDSDPVVTWLKEQSLWSQVTDEEQAFLIAKDRTEAASRKYQWHMEAQWALLWLIERVESLGLPTKACDSRRMVDDIVPALDSDVSEFIDGASLRTPGEILGEDDRTYDLWCRWHLAKREGKPLPHDLNYWILYERRYAFEWLDGNEEWDAVTCDA